MALWLPGLLVAAGAIAATAHGLYEVAIAAQVPPAIAWLYPVITDGLALVAYAVAARLQGPARHYSWAVVTVAAGLSGLAQGVDVGGIVGGLSFALPQDQGLFSSLLIAVALIGAVGSSIGTLLYAEFVRDKGWRGPHFLKLQRLDLAVGLGATLVINLAIWTVGAETFGGTDRTVEHESDLVDMMTLAIGELGPLLLWVAFFFITFSSFPAFGRGYANLLVGGIHASLEERGRRYSSAEKDPIFRWVQLVALYAVPVFFALPMFSNLVLFTVAGSSMAALLAPLVIAGIIVLTSRKRFMHDGYANRWWEIVVLILVGCFALWASWAVLTGLGDLLSS